MLRVLFDHTVRERERECERDVRKRERERVRVRVRVREPQRIPRNRTARGDKQAATET